jgi:erythromycin esterase
MLAVKRKLQWYFLVCWVPILLFSCSQEEEDNITPTTPTGQNTSLTIPASAITPLQTEQDLDVLLNQIGTATYVLLGEASHGTSEFYTWRAAITRRLILEKGFNIIAVEGDWPAAYEVNRYIRNENNAANAVEVLQNFQRWPTWMWANQEIADLTEWLHQHNQSQTNNPVGFYGLDLYSLWESLDAIGQFAEADAATRAAVQNAQSCLAPYNRDEQAYGYASSGCAEELTKVLEAIQNQKSQLPAGHEAVFNAEQNALVAINAERYYSGAGNTWNIRDQHMTETINRLMAHRGSTAKIIVWEHNTHVGDARYTDMAASGEVNVGQLVRQQHADAGVHVVGFGTYEGTVIASDYWGGPITNMPVPPAPAQSWEALLHQTAPANKLVDLKALRQNQSLTQSRGHRAIGVVYNPEMEAGNYVPSNLPTRYDSFIFIDKTQALHPLQ